MESISTIKTFNMGGLAALKFAGIDHFDNIPRAYDGKIDQDITFKPGYSWLDLDFIELTASFSENESMTDDGILYDKRIRCAINRRSPEMQQLLRQLNYQKFVFLVFDQNFHESAVPPMLVGDQDNWLEFSKDQDSGRQPGELNNYQLTFRGRSKFESAWYLGTY